MLQYNLFYNSKKIGFETKTFDDVEEALKYIEVNSDNLTCYTLWEINSKLIKKKEMKKND